MARPLCLRLGAGPSGATLARRIRGTSHRPDDEHTVCQVAVSLSLANSEASLPVAYRLYLPQDWAADPVRRGQAGGPGRGTFQTQTGNAPDQIRAAPQG